MSHEAKALTVTTLTITILYPFTCSPSYMVTAQHTYQTALDYLTSLPLFTLTVHRSTVRSMFFHPVSEVHRYQQGFCQANDWLGVRSESCLAYCAGKVFDRMSKGIREAPGKALIGDLAAESGDRTEGAFGIPAVMLEYQLSPLTISTPTCRTRRRLCLPAYHRTK